MPHDSDMVFNFSAAADHGECSAFAFQPMLLHIRFPKNCRCFNTLIAVLILVTSSYLNRQGQRQLRNVGQTQFVETESGHDNAVAAILSFWGSEQGSEIDRTKKNKMDGNTEKKGKREKSIGSCLCLKMNL